jgi:hypothetical protein
MSGTTAPRKYAMKTARSSCCEKIDLEFVALDMT